MMRMLMLVGLTLAGWLMPARAAVVYEFNGPIILGGPTRWSFLSQDIIIATTTIQASSLITATSTLGTIAAVRLTNPSTAAPQVETLLAPGGPATALTIFFDPAGPFDHIGTYTAADGSTLTISTAVPEPGSFLLFTAGVIPIAWLFRRRRSRTRLTFPGE